MMREESGTALEPNGPHRLEMPLRPAAFLCLEKENERLVPSKGLEPPHRCRYMDLNHARLPIPPRWQVDFNSPGSP
jgi:hypothetical protein